MVQTKAVILAHDEPPWVHALEFGDTPKVIQNLPYGDAWLATDDATIAVERKTTSDLIASIQDGRLFAQVADMVKATKWSYVIVHDNAPVIINGCLVIGGNATAWTWPSIMGALLKAQEMGAGVIFTMSAEREEYKQALIRLANRDRGPISVARKREATDLPPGLKVLCSIKGISETRAEQLVARCESAAHSLVVLNEKRGYKPKIPKFPWKSLVKSARFALGLQDHADGSWDDLTIVRRLPDD